MSRFARMKEGERPIVLNGCVLVPPFPAYWEIPAVCSAAIELFVKTGLCEYQPAFQHAPAAATATAPALPAPAAATSAFARKRA